MVVQPNRPAGRRLGTGRVSECVRIGDWCTLYHADSLDVMDEFRSHAPNALITDPPYHIPTHVASGRNLHRSVGDLSIVERGLAAYFDPMADMLSEDGRAFVFADGTSYSIVFRIFYSRWRVQSIVWDKGSIGMGRDFRKQHELILHAWRADTSKVSDSWSDILKAKRVNRREHPAQKPVLLLDQLVAACGATVIDPFMGSGSTALAAMRAGRRFVGCEIDKKWFDVAVARIRRSASDGTLFDD